MGCWEGLCLLLLLNTPVTRPEKFEVVGPAEPVIAEAGENVILPCYLKPNISAVDLTVEWLRVQSLDPLVHLYEKHEIRNEKQIQSYRGRTELFMQELQRGNASLRLTAVRGSDHGEYKCFIQSPEWYDYTSVHLVVKATGSQPVISIEGQRQGGLSLLCETKGWHPEPEMVWMDGEGQTLDADPAEAHRDNFGLFNVKRHVIVQERGNNRFTCGVRQQLFAQEKETHYNVAGELFHPAQPWMVAFAVISCLAVAVVIGTAVLIHRCVRLRRRKDGLKTDKEFEKAQKHAVDVTLDPDTAHAYLILSGDGKQVSDGDEWQNVPDNPERFDPGVCVLGKPGFSSGRVYYEVWVGGKTKWVVGVAKESISRKGGISPSPRNGYWTIWLRNGTEYEALADPSVSLSLSEKLQKVGVYVDYEGGQVSFYNAETSSHIYSYTNHTFTDKLYPYFSPTLNDGGTNSAPLIITPVSI